MRPKKMFHFEESMTQDRIRRLESYYQANVLSGGQPICEHGDACRRSVAMVRHFHEGQLSHVGQRYDILKCGCELRVVITGISYGHGGRKDLTERTRQVMHQGLCKSFYKRDDKIGRNPHMRGTTLLLKRILLGEVSTKDFKDYAGEFVGGTKTADDHIFSMFALVNLLLCSARGDSATDKSSQRMKALCFNHYLETLGILQPNLVVFQTMGTAESLFREAGLGSYWRRETPNLGRFTAQWLDFTFCEFYHPSHPAHLWGCKPGTYFRDTVSPTLSAALKHLGIE